MHHSITVILCQYKPTNSPQEFKNLLTELVHKRTTVIQVSVASICLQMQKNTSVICCQDQATNAPQYYSYLLPESVYKCTTVL